MLARLYRYLQLGCLATALACASAVHADMPVAYVQSARLMKEAPQIKQLKQRVAEAFSARQARLKQLHEHILVLKHRLDRDGAAYLDEVKRRGLDNQISAEQVKYKQMRDELTQDKQLRYAEEEARVARVIREVVEQVAQDERIGMVLQSGALWVSPRVDITDKVLARLRKMAENKQ